MKPSAATGLGVSQFGPSLDVLVHDWDVPVHGWDVFVHGWDGFVRGLDALSAQWTQPGHRSHSEALHTSNGAFHSKHSDE